MKHRQQGFAHLQLVVLLVLVLGVVGFGAYKVGQNQSDANRNAETEDIGLADEIKVVEEEAPEEVKIPAEEKPVEEKKVEQPVEKKTEPTPEKTEEKKEDKVWLEMTKVSASQSGSVFKVASRLPQSLSGTCHFKLYQEGYERVYSSKKISNSKDCVGQLNIDDLPTYDGWELHVWFDGSDGNTHAYQKESSVSLTDPSAE